MKANKQSTPRTKIIQITLAPNEKIQIDNVAKKMGLSTSSFVRMIVFNKMKEEPE